MLSVDEATRAVLAKLGRTDVVEVALDAAQGMVVAEAVIAGRALPGFDNSAMDGYAARASDLPGALPLVGESAAGGALAPLAAGACQRIFTGARLPPGADTVVMQEDVRVVDGGRVALPAAKVGDNVRRAGEDVAIGDVAIAAGTRLGAWQLGVCAGIGAARVRCRRRPLVAIVATGDELVDVDTEPGPGQLVDSSAHVLRALVRDAGGEPAYLGIAKDDPGAIRELLDEAFAHDVVITTGGVSVGDRDHVKDVLAAAGVAPELWKVAMKPGKPFSFGLRGALPVFGLPGNPVSTAVAFELFVRPALLAMQGATTVLRPRVPVVLAAPYAKQAGRAHYLRARVERGDDGALVARVSDKQGSAMLSSLAWANALVEIPAETTRVERDARAIVLDSV